MNSRLAIGTVAHRRFTEVDHGFRYGLYMALIDLDEVDRLPLRAPLFRSNGRALVEFRRTDYLGDPDVPLADAVRQRVEKETGYRPTGPIRMLTHLRTLGVVFNPVTFYYCYDEAGEQIEAIVAEITNTPWRERHAYVLPATRNRLDSRDRFEFRQGKEFHVSPFLGMDYQYAMAFNKPDESVQVSIENYQGDRRHFAAALHLKTVPFTAANLLGMLVRVPAVTLRVVVGIYWQALRLKLKGATYHAHPPATLAREAT